ncbi:MAG TPA: hypothetical protein PLW99_00945 [Candidatus Paceibacterota bacterium]|nr:MAG: hypothetical protein B7X03_00280 [Parcubacteria group bacterium 21-58-10]OYV83119.1 MAG: hypothetical protein B7W96_00635 [Parcubacteria group bacterium 37-58-5]HQT82700.1 hypothetical protein [Candidatus Paceibacterota bacterium]
MTTLTISRGNVAVASAAQGVSVLDAVTAISADFTETGTLVFYPNNTGPVPYLFYQNPNGSTVAKALVFPYSSPNDFSSWVGAQISVTGHVNSEHVIVSTITYLSAP